MEPKGYADRDAAVVMGMNTDMPDAARYAVDAATMMGINQALASANIRATPPKREKCQVQLRNQAKRDRQRAEELFRRASEADKIADQIERMPPEIEHLIADYFGISSRSVQMYC